MVTRRQVLGGIGGISAAAALGMFAVKPLEPPRMTTAEATHGPGYFPNSIVTTHEGKRLRFYDDLIKNKFVVINMMYAQCSEGVCPVSTMNMRRVQKALGDRVGRDIHMYSITLLPFFDTPEVLNKYARDHDAGPGWQFITGKESDIEVIRRKLGFYDLDPKIDADKTQHAGIIRIGHDAYDRWLMAPALGNVQPILHVIRHADRISS